MPDLTTSFASEIAALHRLVHLSSGTPAFAFALCNRPAVRQEVIAQFTSPEIAVAALSADTMDPVATARALIPEAHCGAVFVTGIETLLSDAHPDSAGHSARLNRSRERWRSSFPSQLLVFWLSEQALLRILREAPDFRAWVSHELDFIEPLAAPAPAEHRTAPVSAEAVRRAAALTARLAGGEELPPMQRLSLIRELLRLGPASPEAAELAEEGIQQSLHRLRQRALAAGDHHAQRDLEIALDDVADSYLELNHNHAALRHYEESHAIAERLAASDPANKVWQRDLSVSLNKLGDLAVAQGDLAGALRSFSESKSIAERLASSDPANTQWQHDLSISLQKLGDLAMAQRDLTNALGSFTEASRIRERLAISNRANAAWQRDLSISLYRLGDLAVEQGDLAGASRCYTESNDIINRLAAGGYKSETIASKQPKNVVHEVSLVPKTDLVPKTNLVTTSDLYANQIKLGMLHWAKGQLEEARHSFADSKKTAESLLKDDRGSAEWQYNLCASLVRLGDIAVAMGELAKAICFLQEESVLWERFKKTHEKYDGWEKSPSRLLRKLGNPNFAQCDLTGALNHYKKDKKIFERLDDKDPKNIVWMQEQSKLLENLWDAAMKSELWPGALSCINLCKSIEKHLSSDNPLHLSEIETKRKTTIGKCGHLIHKLKAKDTTGRWAYYFVLVLDAQENPFLEAIKGDGTIDLEDFGEVIDSCYGQEPNQEIKARLKEEYGFDV